MEISLVFHSHPSEVTWEKYAFRRLNQQEEDDALEAHLLACDSCREVLQQEEEHILLMRAGLMSVNRKGLRALACRVGGSPVRANMWATLLCAATLGAGYLAVWLPLHSPSKAPAALVQLASLRGKEESGAHARARQPLNLRIPVADIPADLASPESYRVEIVSSSGEPVFRAKPGVSKTELSVQVPKGFAKGSYWVRLYGGQAEVLGEFGLKLD